MKLPYTFESGVIKRNNRRVSAAVISKLNHRIIMNESDVSLASIGKPVKRPHNFIDRTGIKYGRLTVISFSKIENASTMWNCKCDCGNIVTVAGLSLSSGNGKSCGCLQKELVSKRCKTHGESKTSKEYRTWGGIKTRCYNKKRNKYKNYGGRGIRVCDRWLESFENFLSDMGRAPSPIHSIERKNNDWDYHPDNCIWAVPKIQGNNTTRNVFINIDGITKTASQWSVEMGFPSGSIITNRINSGMNPVEAVKRHYKPRIFKCKSKNL